MFVFSRCGGLLGRLIVDRLGRYGHTVGVLGASADQINAMAPAGNAVAIPLNDDAEVARQLAYARALLLLPEGPDERPVNEAALVAQAQASGTRRILRLSLHGADPDADTRLLREHGIADAALAKSDIPYSILRPHLLMQDLLLFAPSIRRGHPLRGSVSAPRVGYVDVRDVADAAVTLLQRPIHEGHTFTLTGPRTWSLDEIAQAISGAIGETVPYEAVPDDEMADDLEQIGLSKTRARSVAGVLAAYRHDEPVSRSISRLTGLPPRALEMFLLDHRAQYTTRKRPAEPMMGEAVVAQLDHALSW